MTTLDVYKDWLGIAEGPRPPGHYELLRLVKFEDDLEKIRGNYKKLNAHVRKYASGQYSIRSQELLNELAKAMLCLTDPERKREYDEGLGRVIKDEGAQIGAKSLGKYLLERQLVSRDQLKEAEGFAEARGLSLRDAVVQMKLADPTTAAQALAEELGRPFLDLADVFPDDSVLDKVPRSTVKRHSALPLFIDNDTILVACVDEPDPELQEELRLRFGIPMHPVISTPLAINQGISKYYAAGSRDESAVDAMLGNVKGKKSAKAKGAKIAKTPKVHKAFAKMSPEEQRQQTQYGYVIMCWATVASVLVDQFLLKDRVFPYLNAPIFNSILSGFPFSQFLVTLIVPPLAIVWVFKVYWK